MEGIFPLHSPNIIKIGVVRRGAVRRAKLYYLRERVGKAAKVKEKKRQIKAKAELKMTNDKAQMTNEIQNPNDKKHIEK